MQRSILIVSIVAGVLIAGTFVTTTKAATSNSQVVGHGTGGDIFCSSTPNRKFGTGISNIIIDFSAAIQQGGKAMTGEWSIVIDPSSQIPGSKEGTITSGHIGKNSYVLKGEETVNSISDCGVFNPPPTTVTISGKCGEDVKI